MDPKEFFEKLADGLSLEKILYNMLDDGVYPLEYLNMIYKCQICDRYYPNLEEHCKEINDIEHLVMLTHGS